MKTLIHTLLISLVLVSCGVDIHSEKSSSNHFSNEISYTISEIDDWDETLSELTTGCIDLNDTEERGKVEIEDSRLWDVLKFSWNVKFDSVVFKVSYDDQTLSKLNYDESYFDYNKVKQIIKTREGVKFLLEIEKSNACF